MVPVPVLLKALLGKAAAEIAGKLPEIFIQTQKSATEVYTTTVTTAVDGYKHHTQLKQDRYLAELEHQQREADRVQQSTEAALSRRHQLDLISETAQVDLWFRAEVQRQQDRHESRPFAVPPDDVRRLARQAFTHGARPLLLTAPFSDDTQTAAESDHGPRRYRTGLSNSWAASPWSGDAVSYDGLISRPLRQGDLDVQLIRDELADFPVIMINGQIQAGSRLWLSIWAWGVVSGDAGVRIQFPPIPVPDRWGRRASVAGKARLEFEDLIAAPVNHTVAQLLDWYHLTTAGRIPRLQATLPPDDGIRRLVAAGSLAGFPVAVAQGVLTHVDAVVGAARVAISGGLTELGRDLITALSDLVWAWDEDVSDRTLRELAGLAAAAREAKQQDAAQAAHRLAAETAHRLLGELPGGGL